MSRPLVVVVAKSTTYRRFVELRRDTLTLRLLAQNDVSVRTLKRAHDAHEATLNEVLSVLAKLGVRTRASGMPHQPFSVQGVSMVITVGGDGTLLAASHQVNAKVPILGINSAPDFSVGFFCGLRAGLIKRGLPRALEGKLPARKLTRMEVRLNGKVMSRRVLNDVLFCHASPAATSRYLVEYGKTIEEQKSSGVWIGPAAGSTAAQRSAGGKVLPLTSTDLQFIVREPFTYQRTPTLLRAIIPQGSFVRLYSKMREAKIFIDGPHNVIDVGLGDRLRFAASPEPLTVLGISGRRR